MTVLAARWFVSENFKKMNAQLHLSWKMGGGSGIYSTLNTTT